MRRMKCVRCETQYVEFELKPVKNQDRTKEREISEIVESRALLIFARVVVVVVVVVCCCCCCWGRLREGDEKEVVVVFVVADAFGEKTEQ